MASKSNQLAVTGLSIYNLCDLAVARSSVQEKSAPETADDFYKSNMVIGHSDSSPMHLAVPVFSVLSCTMKTIAFADTLYSV